MIEEEKRQHSESLNKLSKELRDAKNREAKYMELMKALKLKGCPVEELYTAYIKKKGKS